MQSNTSLIFHLFISIVVYVISHFHRNVGLFGLEETLNIIYSNSTAMGRDTFHLMRLSKDLSRVPHSPSLLSERGHLQLFPVICSVPHHPPHEKLPYVSSTSNPGKPTALVKSLSPSFLKGTYCSFSKVIRSPWSLSILHIPALSGFLCRECVRVFCFQYVLLFFYDRL